MLEKKQLWLTALAGGVASFFIAKGEKVTQFFAWLSAFLGAFSVSELGVIGGLVLGLASFFLTWTYKHKNHTLLKSKIERGESVEAFLDEDDRA
ncbi:phage holin family protein [Vibrio sp. S4M6]|uniref:phage holin family protein n=1 Tax=Vibrio sinus TaxID=2946865 RepID=UPI00202A7064|nr:phage holin family protein [Vibrio sinus]MCL9783647.1 phage holin family protein [Vibrio sinus]